MSFTLGAASLAHLAGVHPNLVKVVDRAIQLTEQDFTVMEGVRSVAAERQHVADGTSHTMNSKHLLQADGFGHAVDLVPWIDGKPSWDWPAIYKIAASVALAAAQLQVGLRWGGCWDRKLSDLIPTAAGMESAEQAYCERHSGPDFVDGPHFELL